MTERLTITIDATTATELDAFMAAHGYTNRSEAIRDLMRSGLRQNAANAAPGRAAVAVVSFVYDHHERRLGNRLLEAQHDHHALGVGTLHVHLDHDNCLEVAVLRGPSADVRRFADAMMRERGVKHGAANLMPIVANAKSK